MVAPLRNLTWKTSAWAGAARAASVAMPAAANSVARQSRPSARFRSIVDLPAADLRQRSSPHCSTLYAASGRRGEAGDGAERHLPRAPRGGGGGTPAAPPWGGGPSPGAATPSRPRAAAAVLPTASGRAAPAASSRSSRTCRLAATRALSGRRLLSAPRRPGGCQGKAFHSSTPRGRPPRAPHTTLPEGSSQSAGLRLVAAKAGLAAQGSRRAGPPASWRSLVKAIPDKRPPPYPSSSP